MIERLARRIAEGPWALCVVTGILICDTLVVDASHTERPTQAALGALVVAVLVAASRSFTDEERRQMWWCVAFSTAVELFSTQLWGLYRYPLGNVPLYVPPGHGLLFLVAARTSRAPLLVRHERAIVGLVIAIATSWAAWGLWSHRDVEGAVYWPFFVGFLLFSPARRVFVVTFGVTSLLELGGVALGTWHWARVVPVLGFTAGDPPSLVAGGYCTFGVVGIQLERIVSAWRARRRASITGALADGAAPSVDDRRAA